MNRSEEERHHHIHEITSKLKTLGLPYYVYSLEQVILIQILRGKISRKKHRYKVCVKYNTSYSYRLLFSIVHLFGCRVLFCAPFLVFTARKRSLRRLCFYTCLSVILFTEGGICIRGGLHPGGLGRPSPIGYYGIRSTSGRYTAYWNAFLLPVRPLLTTGI